MKTTVFAVLAVLALVATGAFAQGFSVVTLNASSVGSNSAVLVGEVMFNPCVVPDPTEVQFVFNPTQGGNAITLSWPTRYAPSNGTCTNVTDTVISIVEGLLPSTTYYYKLVASSNFRVEGNVVTFTTLAAGAPFIAIPYGPKPIPGSGNLAGCGGCTVTVVGENFGPLAQVFFNDTQIDTGLVYVQSNRLLTFQLPAGLPAGFIWNITVVNNGLRSNTAPLVIIPAARANANAMETR